MCCNKKEETNDFHSFSMLFPILMGVLSGFNHPTTIINIYSDKKIEVKDNE
jgi:hypothetical protein